MGWETRHLHLFDIAGDIYGEPDPEWADVQDHRSIRLYHAAWKVRQSFLYNYDMGDGWQHEITVEDISPNKTFYRPPVCLNGARACPPEDCGGIGGYAELLDIISNPRHERHKRMKEWLGGPFDPEAFYVDAVNKALAKLTPPKARTAKVILQAH